MPTEEPQFDCSVTNPLHVPQWGETQAAADKAGIAVVPSEIPRAEQLQAAFAAFTGERVDALLVPPDITFVANHLRIAELRRRPGCPQSTSTVGGPRPAA